MERDPWAIDFGTRTRERVGSQGTGMEQRDSGVLGASCGLAGCWLVLWVLERRRQ